MATSPANIRVTVGQPNPSATSITVGQLNPSVTAIQYGTRTLKSASDFSLLGAEDGFSIVYRANTNSFVVAPASTSGAVVDAGFF
jgi:hypothetical protein